MYSFFLLFRGPEEHCDIVFPGVDKLLMLVHVRLLLAQSGLINILKGHWV